MKKTFSQKKSAFSLIELSIVLIIIGLLIAGITGGASLIKSSELRSVMGEARGYAVAVNAFYTQFNALPGDYGTAVGGVSGTAGDGDNTIEYYSSGSLSESAFAWIHLRYSGTIDNLPSAIALVAATTSPTFGTSSTTSANAPSSKIKNAGWAFDYRAFTEGNNTAANQNVVVLTGTIGAPATAGANTLLGASNLATASLVGSDALSIDAKIDDGLANLGKVRGVNPASPATTPATTATAGGSCYTYSATAAATYITTSSSSKVCALSYQVDVNS